MELSLEHLIGNQSRSRLSNAKSGVSKPSPRKAPSCREQVEICHVLNFLALLFPISFLNGHHAHQIFIMITMTPYIDD